jgi:hypothetical protein
MHNIYGDILAYRKQLRLSKSAAGRPELTYFPKNRGIPASAAQYLLAATISKDVDLSLLEFAVIESITCISKGWHAFPTHEIFDTQSMSRKTRNCLHKLCG